jgi:hypothetical protein
VYPSLSALERARILLESATLEDTDSIPIPTGSTWSVLPIVTPEGLVKHFVEISLLDTDINVRGTRKPQNFGLGINLQRD